jgi:hypothetical protein
MAQARLFNKSSKHSFEYKDDFKQRDAYALFLEYKHDLPTLFELIERYVKTTYNNLEEYVVADIEEGCKLVSNECKSLAGSLIATKNKRIKITTELCRKYFNLNSIKDELLKEVYRIDEERVKAMNFLLAFCASDCSTIGQFKARLQKSAKSDDSVSESLEFEEQAKSVYVLNL